MKYAVIYQSETGNTEELAKNIFVSLPGNDKTITDAEKMTELPPLPELEQAAFDACGGSYPVRAELTMTEFPLKEYDGFALPAGEYLALRVVIGEGAGRNWWCVVYPPLCTAACTDLEDVAVQAGMDESDMKLITGQEGYVLKFRAVERWERLRQWLGK